MDAPEGAILEKHISTEMDPLVVTSSKEQTMPIFYNLEVSRCEPHEMIGSYREFIKNNRSRFPGADALLCPHAQPYNEVLVLDQSGETLARMFYVETDDPEDDVFPYWGRGKFFDETRLVPSADVNTKTIEINDSNINIIFIYESHEVPEGNYRYIRNMLECIRMLKPRMVRFADLAFDDCLPEEFMEFISKLGFPCYINGDITLSDQAGEFFKECNRKANVTLCDEFKKDIRTAYDQMSLEDLRTKPYLDLPQDVQNILSYIEAPDVLIERDFCLAKIATRHAAYKKALKIYNNIPSKVESQYLTKPRRKTVADIPQLKWEITKRVCIECISMLLSFETKNCSYANLVERYTYVYQYISYLDPGQHVDYDVNIFLRLLCKQDDVELSEKIDELTITWDALYEQVPDHIDRILVDIIGRLKRNNKLNFYLPGDNPGLGLWEPITQVLNVPEPAQILAYKDITITFLQGVLKKKYRNASSKKERFSGYKAWVGHFEGLEGVEVHRLRLDEG